MSQSLKFRCQLVFGWLTTLLLIASLATAAEDSGGENASNPLAKVKNTDLRWRYFDLNSGHTNDFSIEGAFMALDNLKIKYELHYLETDSSGESENNFESALLKGIFFPAEGAWGNVKYRVALGLDWIVDLGDQDKGIGTSDQVGPFGGLAMSMGDGVTLIPLVQQYWSYSGETVNMTAFRLIAMKSLPNQMWVKMDAIVPIDWEHDQAIPATAELQLGKSFNKTVGVYVDGMVGLGTDRTYDWGVGTGVRFNY